MGYIDYSPSGERSLIGHQSYLLTLAGSTYKAMERRYRKAEKQCARAWAAEGGDSAGRDSLSRTGTGTIAVIQTQPFLPFLLCWSLLLSGSAGIAADSVWTCGRRAADIYSCLRSPAS